jgi:hypothetical protein
MPNEDGNKDSYEYDNGDAERCCAATVTVMYYNRAVSHSGSRSFPF